MNWLKKKLPSKESFLAFYATMYSLTLIALLVYTIFSQRGAFEKIILFIVVVIMALKLPTPDANNHDQKAKKKKAIHPKTALQDGNQGKKKRKRRKRTSTKKVIASKQITIDTLHIEPKVSQKTPHEEVMNNPAPKTIKPLSAPIHELTQSRKMKQPQKHTKEHSNNQPNQKLSKVETHEVKQLSHNSIVKDDAIQIDEIETMDLAREPENIDLILSTLRSRVAANVETDRIVDITHMREHKGNWDANDLSIQGFDSVTGHPTSITVKCVSFQSDVARLADKHGEYRWVKMPEDFCNTELVSGQDFEVQLIKFGSKYRALKVKKLVC
ncbi:hypothetical protein [Brevibacillus reuszeri]|uniref:hypothetical protein n=1 Tax=Brevibacillus reuszeri TaxID=54915 RepID=UPI000CCBD8D2|nr:hypothetical protein [Brevibacillus reuszeri]